MRKIKLLIIIMICLFITNVKADMGPPSIIEHKVMVTNKNGAQCYEDGKKTNVIIPYKTILKVSREITGSYIYVNDDSDKYSCDVKYSDVSAVNQNFNLNNEDVTKIDTEKAIILATGGLNMRKGPSVTYGKITTIPEKSIVKLTHMAGSYWYYADYNGKLGWVTGMDGYLGFECTEILVNYEPVKIYAANMKTVLGTIPANTEITDYLDVSDSNDYYVVYKNIKGYIDSSMLYKTDGTGKIKLIKDVEVRDDNDVLKTKLTANQVLEYTMKKGTNIFYIPAKKLLLTLEDNQFEEVVEKKYAIKTSGYIGEGLFGEEKLKKEEITDPKTLEETEEDTPVVIEEEKTLSIKDMIIIGLLAGILLALTALVIIKLVNSKKKQEVVKPKEGVKEESNFEKITDKEIAEARVELIKKVKSLDNEEDNNKEV